jgi:hypothetical protein
MSVTTKDGVDITRLVSLHRKFHGLPMSCLVRRHRETIAERQDICITASDEEHGRGAEPQGHQGQRSQVLAQARAEESLARV